MKSKLASKVGLIALMCFLAPQVWAGSKLFNVQGKLTNSAGTPLAGTFTVTFRLYANSTDPIASAVWTENQSVTVSAGVFNVALGNVTSLDAIPFNKPYYLGIQVAGDANELSPRQLLGASAYALGSLGPFNVKGNLYVTNTVSATNATLTGYITVASSVTASGISVNGMDVGSYLVPPGAIMLFAANCPTGWNRYAALDNLFPMGAATYGATGGAATHTHSISTDGDHTHTTPAMALNTDTVVSGPSCVYTTPCPTWAPYYPGQTTSTAGAHNHGGATGAASSLPPFLGMVFCQKA